ncbi:MAG: S-layer homology domain-containing protein [Thermaceae bacterium]
MKKRLVILLAGLLTVLSMGFGLAQFSDVPAGHWAREAVETLVAKGIMSGFADGTFRGNEPFTRYQAALVIYRLLQQIEAEMKAKGESSTLEALSAEDLQVLKNAVQELASELAALGVRVSALEDSAATKDDIARLEAMIEELKAKPMPEVEPGMDQAALQDLMDRVEAAAIAADTALAQAQQLAEGLEALSQEVEGVKGDVAGLQSQVEANAGAIQALNELAVLLNQDVLALQDRVTALEKLDLQEFATKEDVTTVQEFAAALRSVLVNFSEKVGALEEKVDALSGKVSTLERNAFTISGSLDLTYQSGNSNLSGGFSGYDFDRLISGTFLSKGDTDTEKNGQVVDDEDEAITNTSGSTKATLNLKIQTGKLDAKSSGGANAYPGLLQFSLKGSWTDPAAGKAADIPNNYQDLRHPLEVDAVKTTLTVAEGQTLSFTFGQSLNTKFTEYVMDNEKKSLGHGFVATLKGLPLGASLTGVYGEANLDPNNPQAYDYVKGIRLALQPAQNLSLGLSYAQHEVGFQEVGGVDATLELGPAKVSGEYFLFGQNIQSGSVGGYVQLAVPTLLGLEANYRGLATGAKNPAGLSLDGDKDNPFRDGQRGFTVKLGLPVFDLGLLYNVQMDDEFGKPKASALKVDLSSPSLRGFTLGAGATLASKDEWFPLNFSSGTGGVLGPKTTTDYKTALTATLKHAGQAPDALVRNLNLTVVYTNQTLLGGSVDSLAAYGDYSTDFGPLSVKKAGARYSDPNLNNPGDETLKAGLQAALDLSSLPLNPGLTGEVAYRATGSNDTELKYGFGVKFGEFLFKRSALEVKAAQYSTTGQVPVKPDQKDTDSAFDFSKDHLYATTTAQNASGTLSGVYVTWTYWDLAFTYGFFKNKGLFDSGTADYGRVFRIKYVVNF